MENILEVKGLTKTYEGFKLEKLNLNVPKGAIIGLIGENGAGKSTTIKLILDIIKKDSGEIKIFGRTDFKDDRKINEDIGLVLDESCFPENLSLKDVGIIMKSIYKNWDKDAFENFRKRLNLPIDKKVKEYSKGMKMKLSLAVALSHNAKFLILDEATSGLDPVVRDEILDIFLEFIQDEEKSILISSHIVSDLEKICDYIAFIHKGKLIFNESKDLLKEKYGILRCSEKELVDLDKEFIIKTRKNKFGTESLVIKSGVKKGTIVDGANIEDIMLYYIK